MSARKYNARLVLPIRVEPDQSSHGASLRLVNAHGVLLAFTPETSAYDSPAQRLIDRPNLDDIAKRVNAHDELLDFVTMAALGNTDAADLERIARELLAKVKS